MHAEAGSRIAEGDRLAGKRGCRFFWRARHGCAGKIGGDRAVLEAVFVGMV